MPNEALSPTGNWTKEHKLAVDK